MRLYVYIYIYSEIQESIVSNGDANQNYTDEFTSIYLLIMDMWIYQRVYRIPSFRCWQVDSGTAPAHRQTRMPQWQASLRPASQISGEPTLQGWEQAFQNCGFQQQKMQNNDADFKGFQPQNSMWTANIRIVAARLENEVA